MAHIGQKSGLGTAGLLSGFQGMGQGLLLFLLLPDDMGDIAMIAAKNLQVRLIGLDAAAATDIGEPLFGVQPAVSVFRELAFQHGCYTLLYGRKILLQDAAVPVIIEALRCKFSFMHAHDFQEFRIARNAGMPVLGQGYIPDAEAGACDYIGGFGKFIPAAFQFQVLVCQCLACCLLTLLYFLILFFLGTQALLFLEPGRGHILLQCKHFAAGRIKPAVNNLLVDTPVELLHIIAEYIGILLF